MLKRIMWQLITSFLILALSSSLNALPDNSSTPDDSYPIQINSDSADFDDKTGDATHRGNVVVDQGTRHLTADTLIIHRDANGKIDKMVAYGSPARFHAYPDPGKPILQGKSNIMKYYPYQDKIVLEEDAELTQNQKTVQGPIITYFMNTRVLSSESNGSQRTTVIIQPKAKEEPEVKHGK